MQISIFKFVYRRVLLTLCVLSMLPRQEIEPLNQDSFYVHSWFDGLFILFVVEESVA